MKIRRVRREDQRELRELRLDALRDAPYAFVTRLEIALSYPGRRAPRGRRSSHPNAPSSTGWRPEGFPQIELGVSSDSERAERLYARCGFERTGERIHHDGRRHPSGWRERCGR